MLFQRTATSVREAYSGRQDVEAQLEAAGAYRSWADSLAVDPEVRAALVEPIAAVEDGLREVLRRRRGTGQVSGASTWPSSSTTAEVGHGPDGSVGRSAAEIHEELSTPGHHS